MLQTKARILNYNINPNDIGREANEAYESMTSVAGVTSVLNTLAGIAKTYQLKEDERGLIDIDRQINQINQRYVNKFSKLENYANSDEMLATRDLYEQEMAELEADINDRPFTKTARTKARDNYTALKDKVDGIYSDGLEVRQQYEDMNTVIAQQAEIKNMIQLEVENGMKDPEQVDKLATDYYNNVMQRVTMGLIGEAEGKAEFTAMYTKAVDEGILLKALEQIDLDPQYADLTDPEVRQAKMDAQAKVLDDFDVDTVMQDIEDSVAGDPYADFIDMNQARVALMRSHKAGTEGYNRLLSGMEAYRKKLNADAEAQKIADAKQAKKDIIKEAWATQSMMANLQNGASYYEARNKYNEEMGLMPAYREPRDVFYDDKFLMESTGHTKEEFFDIDNDLIAQYPHLSKERIDEAKGIWENDEIANGDKYAQLLNIAITSAMGDSNMVNVAIKEIAGKIEGIDKGMLYLGVNPDAGTALQVESYKQQNEMTLRNGVRNDIMTQKQDIALKSLTKTTMKRVPDQLIGIAEQFGDKGIATQRDESQPLYNFANEANARPYRPYLGGGIFGEESVAERSYRDLSFREISPQKVTQVMDNFKISESELVFVGQDGQPMKMTPTQVSEIINNEARNDPQAIQRINSIILDLYTESVGQVQGTDFITSDITGKSWGYVGEQDVPKAVKKEAIRIYIQQRVLEMTRQGDIPKPYDTYEPVQQLNYMGLRRD